MSKVSEDGKESIDVGEGGKDAGKKSWGCKR